jgi:autotransporter-associated beta strand protein
MVIAALAAARGAEASTYRWQVDASGNWNTPANWAVVEGPAGVGYPNLPGDVAVFDERLTAPRTVTIPDTVTISIGRLTVALSPISAALTIDRAGTGLLVFDNLGEDAVIESSGTGERAVLSTPIQLAADVTVNGTFRFGDISEAGGARNATIIGGSIAFGGTNTTTGTTTLTDGGLACSRDAIFVSKIGTLVVGDGTGAAGSAELTVDGNCIDPAADVQVNADGRASFGRNTLVPGSGGHTINDLTIAGGQVTVGMSHTSLTVQDVTMEGGEVLLGIGPGHLVVTGSVTATSTAAGPAVVRSTSTVQPGSLGLGPGGHNFIIANGPQAVDFLTDGPGISGAGVALTKQGAGVMRIGSDSSYSGVTSIEAGEVIVDANVATSPFAVGTNGVLSGTGTVGPLITQANGRVRPGANPGVGILSTGAAILTNGALSIDINGPTAPAGHDMLMVTGSVTLTGAALDLTVASHLSPNALFTIVNNDGSDPVMGTFAGLPEGATVAVQSTTFMVSYVGGDGNDVVLTNTTPITYFLSEGATGSFFDEDVLIANPNTVPAPITMTFFLPGGGTVVREATVPAQSRLTVEVDEISGLEATSASVEVLSVNRLQLAVERTMFWDSTHYGGHTANATPSADQQWFFAEGAQGFFDTYLLLANPNASPATATVTFLLENGTPFVLDVPLPARSRETVYAGDHAQLVGQAFGVKVDATLPITAERAMYFQSTPERLWSGGHDNVGSPAPSMSWFHPEGASGTFFNTFILMSNPQTSPANVTLRFLLPDGGQPIELTKQILPQQRLTVNPAAEGIPSLQNASFSTVVSSNVPIVSERAMYWSGDDVPFGEGHASSGLTGTARAWALAEGRVGGPDAYTTYILLANPTFIAASVRVTFLRESGDPLVKTYNVGGGTRFNIDVGGMVPELQNESFGAFIEVVTASASIAVERSMYWNSQGRFWAGGTNAVGTVVQQ